MATMNTSSVFLGMAPAKCRPFIFSVLKHLRSKYSKLIVPCVGNFTIPLIAVRAGWLPQDIFASDISLYSTLLARGINGQPIEDLAASQIQDERLLKIIDHRRGVCVSDLIILMKILQLDPSKKYLQNFITELETRSTYYRESIDATIAAIAQKLQGINYAVMDLRDEIKEKNTIADALFWINPPLYKGGYAKLFDFKGVFDWKVKDVPEFNWKQEFHQLYENNKNAAAMMLFYNGGKCTEAMKKDVVFFIEKDYGHNEYILATRPQEISPELKTFKAKKEIVLKPLKVQFFGAQDTLRPDSIITVKQVKAENALYYRNLWLHKLGQTNAEAHTMWFIDGKLFAVCGFHCSDINRLKTQYIFENYGFSVDHPKYKNLVRLLMMCLCSIETKHNILRNLKIVSKNPMIDIRGISTTCLSKYRKVKLNNGILKIVKREKLPNDFYKTLYVADFEKRGYSDCITLYLKEVEERTNDSEGTAADEDL